MRLLLFSDIHANLEAMEACLAVVPAYDLLVNLGDVVGYNASPNEVCEKVRAMGGTIVRGNHDRACSGLTDLAEFNLVAAMSARWTQTVLTPENLEWLQALPQGPMRHEGLGGMEFVHGSPRDEDEYLLNPSTAATNLRMPGHANKIFFGHTHLQGGFVLQDGKVRNFAPIFPTGEDVVEYTLPLTLGERYLINPGSIGQPRDGDWRAAFALYEREGDGPGAVTFYRVPYDVEAAQRRIIKANLPERLATRLKMGR
ncbi:MAG: metallophosphoesterase family protein [Candidatus Korobacteraceae bacterium]|jgi:diadenosine tetraphosphatase ApaH/serine/threonine PP2A family protein phosphatase